MTAEGSAARLVRNTLTNGFGAALGVLVFLILTPFMILQLGAEAYGVFTLALSLSFLGGYAALVDLGVEAATARYIAEARSDCDSERVNRLASTTMLFFGSAALVIAPFVAGAALLLVDLFDVRTDLRGAAALCFALTGAQLLFELPARAYFAVLEGAQRFAAFQACEILRIVSQAAMFVTVLLLDLGIGALGGAVALSSLFVLVLARLLAHRHVPELRVTPRLASRAQLRALLSYGGGLVGLRLVGTVFRQMDRVIIGAFLGPAFVTVYEIANKVQSAAQMVQSIAASALVPAAAYARAQVAVLRDMFLRGTGYTLAASIPVAVAVAIFAEPLIRTWIDARYVEAAAATRLFAIYLLMGSVLIVGTTMTLALGHVRFLLLVTTPTVAANLVLSLVLVRSLGVEGVVIGSVASFALSVPFLLRFFLQRFDVTGAVFLRRSILPQLPGVVVQGATAAPLLWLAARTDSLVVVGLLSLLSMVSSVAAYVAVGIRGLDRAALLDVLARALGRRPTDAAAT